MGPSVFDPFGPLLSETLIVEKAALCEVLLLLLKDCSRGAIGNSLSSLTECAELVVGCDIVFFGFSLLLSLVFLFCFVLFFSKRI